MILINQRPAAIPRALPASDEGVLASRIAGYTVRGNRTLQLLPAGY
jgi:hypothetical protein